jgi:hypothetical protein
MGIENQSSRATHRSSPLSTERNDSKSPWNPPPSPRSVYQSPHHPQHRSVFHFHYQSSLSKQVMLIVAIYVFHPRVNYLSIGLGKLSWWTFTGEFLGGAHNLSMTRQRGMKIESRHQWKWIPTCWRRQSWIWKLVMRVGKTLINDTFSLSWFVIEPVITKFTTFSFMKTFFISFALTLRAVGS